MEASLQAVADHIREADAILFITGAGISVDSGLPTYRGVAGLYEGQATAEGIPIEEVLSKTMFAQDPALTMKYLWQIGEACRGAKPNRGHEVIAEMEREKENVWVMTQNVDGLHRAAGSGNLIEVHGNAEKLLCTACSFSCLVEDYVEDADALSLPLHCPRCEGIIRPDVVLFEEMLSENTMQQMLNLGAIRFDLICWVGTSAPFFYIIEPLARAKRIGAMTVEINPSMTHLSPQMDHKFSAGAAETLEELWRLAQAG